MYGLQGKFMAHPGKRDQLLGLLLKSAEDLKNFDGCYLYVISTTPTDPDAIWITEAWRSKVEHDASLQLESTRAVIAQARPLIAGMSDSVELEPVGGVGLPTTSG
jgi:quinol monooxygenase YgiN